MTSARKACIAGIGQTAYTKRDGLAPRSELALGCEAIRNACADAGLSVSAVDAIVSFSGDTCEPALVQKALRLPVLHGAAMAWHPGGGGVCGALALAAALVESGQASCVALVRSIRQRASARYGQAGGSYRALSSLNEPFGLFAPAAMMALAARRRMHAFGMREEHLGMVAVTLRGHAQRNPCAVMRDRPMTLEDYFASRPIADPFRLFDCCLETDGACAVLVTTAERARDALQRPVEILATAVGCDPSWGYGALSGYEPAGDVYVTGNSRQLAVDLYGRAQISAADVDVAQIYDAFTLSVLLALEDFQFCEAGAAGAFVEGGEIAWPNGALPVNTAGGALSEAYLQGVNHIAEAVRQLRGRSTAQVRDAQIALVTGAPAEGPTSAALLHAL